MQKDFDKWNNKKKNLDEKSKFVDFYEREIWIGDIGLNIGSEQNGIGDNFERPILIYKKLSRTTFFGIPLTTKKKDNKFRMEIKTNILGYLLFDQIRVIDIRRLDRKIYKIEGSIYKNIKDKFKELFL